MGRSQAPARDQQQATSTATVSAILANSPLDQSHSRRHRWRHHFRQKRNRREECGRCCTWFWCDQSDSFPTPMRTASVMTTNSKQKTRPVLHTPSAPPTRTAPTPIATAWAISTNSPTTSTEVSTRIPTMPPATSTATPQVGPTLMNISESTPATSRPAPTSSIPMATAWRISSKTKAAHGRMSPPPAPILRFWIPTTMA